MERGRIRGLDRLPFTPVAVSWRNARFAELYSRVLLRFGPPFLLVELAALLLLESRAAFMLFVLIVSQAVFVVEVVFLMDGANAAAPGWLASRWRFRWRYVDTGRLSRVTAIPGGFTFRDTNGGFAVLVLDRTGVQDVLDVVREDILRARSEGLEIPQLLSGMLVPMSPGDS